ncbi:hypothetical protein RNZ50_08150 [Paracoccaceae bacterium Fryx2]|nr:hypothetical protein [Paracoccaceae bacterium Fryx2]
MTAQNGAKRVPTIARNQRPFSAKSAIILRHHSVRSQILGEFSTESGMMKNVSKPVLLSLTFPLPPIADQLALIAALDAGRLEAQRLRSEAAATRNNAWEAFEAAIFAADPATDVSSPLLGETIEIGGFNASHT